MRTRLTGKFPAAAPFARAAGVANGALKGFPLGWAESLLTCEDKHIAGYYALGGWADGR